MLLMGPVFFCEAAPENEEIVETKADASNPLYQIVKTKSGHIFRIPKDMPIEKRDGLIIPLSTEEYFLKKFDALEKKVETLSEKVNMLEEKIRTSASTKKNRAGVQEVGLTKF